MIDRNNCNCYNINWLCTLSVVISYGLPANILFLANVLLLVEPLSNINFPIVKNCNCAAIAHSDWVIFYRAKIGANGMSCIVIRQIRQIRFWCWMDASWIFLSQSNKNNNNKTKFVLSNLKNTCALGRVHDRTENINQGRSFIPTNFDAFWIFAGMTFAGHIHKRNVTHRSSYMIRVR